MVARIGDFIIGEVIVGTAQTYLKADSICDLIQNTKIEEGHNSYTVANFFLISKIRIRKQNTCFRIIQ